MTKKEDKRLEYEGDLLIKRSNSIASPYYEWDQNNDKAEDEMNYFYGFKCNINSLIIIINQKNFALYYVL